MRPSVSRVRAAARSRSPSTVTSHRTTRARRPAATSSAASRSSRSTRRAASATSAPARANSRASAAPIPDDAPVMKTTCPATRPDTLRGLQDERFLGERRGDLGLPHGVAMIALRLRVLVVGLGFGELLLRLVEQRPRVRAQLARLGFPHELLRLLDDDGTVERPRRYHDRVGQEERRHRDGKLAHAFLLLWKFNRPTPCSQSDLGAFPRVAPSLTLPPRPTRVHGVGEAGCQPLLQRTCGKRWRSVLYQHCGSSVISSVSSICRASASSKTVTTVTTPVGKGSNTRLGSPAS